MIGAHNWIGLKAGAVIAAARIRLGDRSDLVEACAGLALIGGLLLAGAALPAML